MSSPKALPAGYPEFIETLKHRVAAARLAAARAVNRELVSLYWDIGEAILHRQQAQGWGQSVVERIASDLRAAFPGVQGFSARNVWDMRRLVETCTRADFLRQLAAELPRNLAATPSRRRITTPAQPGGLDALALLRQLVAEVPWGHLLLILARTQAPAQSLYYLRATAAMGWSRNVLLNQLKAGAFERSLAEGKSHNFPRVLDSHLAEQAEEALKSSYSLEFLGLRKAVKERELEDQLIDRLRDFILELGYGFCFIGRQHRLTLGRKEYLIDLLFYHRFLKALVAVELKVGPFQPRVRGQDGLLPEPAQRKGARAGRRALHRHHPVCGEGQPRGRVRPAQQDQPHRCRRVPPAGSSARGSARQASLTAPASASRAHGFACTGRGRPKGLEKVTRDIRPGQQATGHPWFEATLSHIGEQSERRRGIHRFNFPIGLVSGWIRPDTSAGIATRMRPMRSRRWPVMFQGGAGVSKCAFSYRPTACVMAEFSAALRPCRAYSAFM
ncbi:PDDEXK nuclease domain-containing protein [Xenophilus azovorans]|uniref:PDDEXK nuclease domain-containing protein n=1 Tax=Xenophilus azovorans TaxID=151755 RepID=UPI000B1200BF